MIILEKIYTKTFSTREQAEKFISRHKIQSNFYLGYNLAHGIKWTVSKYKNLNF